MVQNENSTQFGLTDKFLYYVANDLSKELYRTNHYLDTPEVSVNQNDGAPMIMIDLPIRTEDLGRGLIGSRHYTHIFKWHCRGKSGKPGKETTLSPYEKNPFDYVIGLSALIDIIEKNINPLGPKQNLNIWLGVYVPPAYDKGIIRFIRIFFDRKLGKHLVKANWQPDRMVPTSRTGLIQGLQNQQIVGKNVPSDIDLNRMGLEEYTEEMDRRKAMQQAQEPMNYGYAQPQIQPDRKYQGYEQPQQQPQPAMQPEEPPIIEPQPATQPQMEPEAPWYSMYDQQPPAQEMYYGEYQQMQAPIYNQQQAPVFNQQQQAYNPQQQQAPVYNQQQAPVFNQQQSQPEPQPYYNSFFSSN